MSIIKWPCASLYGHIRHLVMATSSRITCHTIHHLRLVSWIWQLVHCTPVASTVNPSKSNMEWKSRSMNAQQTNLQTRRDSCFTTDQNLLTCAPTDILMHHYTPFCSINNGSKGKKRCLMYHDSLFNDSVNLPFMYARDSLILLAVNYT